MTPANIELLRFAFSKGKSDQEIATLLKATLEDVVTTRTTLGLIPTAKKKSGKEEARQYIMDMSPEEKKAFFKEIDPYKLWTMAEGAPETKVEVSQEPIRIDITHQLEKVYGPVRTDVIEMPRDSEDGELPAGPSE